MARQCPPNTFAYTIKAGDTIYDLSREYNTTVQAILSANPEIDVDNLMIGQEICIPGQEQYPPCPGGNYYTIKAGDTLSSVARFFNISVDDLREANPYLENEDLTVGTEICIPLAQPPVTCPEGSKKYTIERGDTIYSIARKYNISIGTLLGYNTDLDPQALLVGQEICIPIQQ